MYAKTGHRPDRSNFLPWQARNLGKTTAMLALLHSVAFEIISPQLQQSCFFWCSIIDLTLPHTWMDSPAIARIFQQLARPSRKCLYSFEQWPRKTPASTLDLRRSYVSGRRGQARNQGGSFWQQRSDLLTKDMSREIQEYPRITARELRRRTHRPRRVKMLTRDFIEGQTEEVC